MNKYNCKLLCAYCISVIPSVWHNSTTVCVCVCKVWSRTVISALHILFIVAMFPHFVFGTPVMCRSSDKWLISRNSCVFKLKCAANNKVWVPIRAQYMRSAGANGLRKQQWTHFGWGQMGTSWWDATHAIAVSMKTGIFNNLSQH